MSTNWTRGPVCGVDNCRSRLYRWLDGRKICQYGHVREDDVEINDEEDDNFIVTRRLNIPSQQPRISVAGSKKKHGEEGRLLFVRCVQFILRKQTDICIELFNIEDVHDFHQIVKYNWIRYLQKCGPQPKLNITIPLIYLSCMSLQIPVYLYDFYDLIMLNKMPYMNTVGQLPQDMRDELPTFYFRVMEADSVPDKGELYRHTVSLNKILSISVELNYSNLVFKLLRGLTLPLQIQGLINELIDVFAVDLRPDSASHSFHLPDYKVFCILILSIELFFYKNQNLCQSWFNVINERPRLRLQSDIEPNDVLFWDNAQIQDYLKLMSKFVLDPTLQSDKDIGKNRLLDLFQPNFEDVEVNLYKKYQDTLIERKIHWNELHGFIVNEISSEVGIAATDLELFYKKFLRQQRVSS